MHRKVESEFCVNGATTQTNESILSEADKLISELEERKEIAKEIGNSVYDFERRA